MLLTDILLVFSLALFCFAWFARGKEWRQPVLWLSALLAFGAGLAGYLDWRWQAVPGLLLAVLFLIVLIVGRLRNVTAPKARKPWVSGILFIVLAVFSWWVIYLFPIFALPEPGGPHSVGVRDFELVDPSRPGLMEAAQDEPRRLKVRVWYPAGDVSGLETRPYFTEQEIIDSASSLGPNLGLPAFFFTHMGHVDTHSYPDAPPLDGNDSWPVVFFSHGYSSHLGQNTALMEHLASHGYLVFSVQHSYDSATVRFEDNSTASMGKEWFEWAEKMRTEGLTENQLKQFVGPGYEERYEGTLGQYQDAVDNDERIGRSVPVWRDDRLFLLDSVAAGRVPAIVQNIAARGDYGGVGHMGMSFGGSTSGSVCQVDSRCSAAVNLDGGNFDPEQVNRDQPAPFLMFHSDWVLGLAAFLPEGVELDPHFAFNDFAYERHETAGLNDDLFRLQVKDSTHLGFSDMGMMARQPVRGMLFGAIDGEEMVAIQNDVVLDFFDRFIRNISNDFPDTAYKRHPAIVPHSAERVRAWWQSRVSTGNMITADPDLERL